MSRRGNRGVAYGAMLLLVLGLIGCAPAEEPDNAPGPDETSGAPAPSSSATPNAAPTLNPDGTAEDNIDYFDAVNEGVLNENSDAMGMDFINALVEAGFDKSAMEVTEDYSTVGNRAESIQFSVRWKDACLIGQNGDAVGGYHSVVMPVLDSGTCLVGNTRPIE
ncbi:hypothetical protein [Microbacterium sp. MPKO10]|uniref:DUF6993 domain-containing protein n=1 Tax=Microbacterium sp. MPKO10 TaxID=2989818 RepID=UPI002235DA8B|nr:hypothetical protein [Microbacterium sp. MPKO10]MCW4459725.1 hypothetical protein [Microbacterium sp. MPKO10]